MKTFNEMTVEEQKETCEKYKKLFELASEVITYSDVTCLAVVVVDEDKFDGLKEFIDHELEND